MWINICIGIFGGWLGGSSQEKSGFNPIQSTNQGLVHPRSIRGTSHHIK